jgi:hypothetical protein
MKMKHWQDPVNALLGVWLIVSPWLLRYSAERTAMADGVIVGVLLIAASLGAIYTLKAWEEWSEAILGLWMIVSPWLLKFSSVHVARNNAVITGIIVLVLALWVLLSDKDLRVQHDRTAH